MALTLDIAPGDYQLSRNEIWASISTDNYIATSGVSATRILTVSGTGATAGQTVTVAFGDYSIVMTFAASLDDSGKKLRVAGALSTANFIAQLAEDFKTNYYIDKFYEIGIHATGVVFNARTQSPDYSITTSSEGATDIAWGSDTVGVLEVAQDNFKVICELEIGSVDDPNLSDTVKAEFAQIVTVEGEPVYNSVKFNLNEFLHAQTAFEIPSYNKTTYERAEYTLFPYRIRYGEKYGTTPEVKKMTTSSVYYFLRGGLSKQEKTYGVDFLTDWVFGEKKFLTWQPRTKTITRTQHEYLYFVVPSGVTAVRVLVKVYYDDQTSETLNKIAATGFKARQVYKVPAGYAQISVGSGAGAKKVLKYELWLINNSNSAVISEVFTYKLTDKPTYGEATLLFENSLGGCDTIRLTGKQYKNFSLSRVQASKISQVEDTVTKGELFNFNIRKRDGASAYTGFLDSNQKNWIHDLFLSENVFEDINAEYTPIVLLNDTVDLGANTENLNGYNIDYIYAFDQLGLRGNLEPAEEEGGGGGS